MDALWMSIHSRLLPVTLGEFAVKVRRYDCPPDPHHHRQL